MMAAEEEDEARDARCQVSNNPRRRCLSAIRRRSKYSCMAVAAEAGKIGPIRINQIEVEAVARAVIRSDFDIHTNGKSYYHTNTHMKIKRTTCIHIEEIIASHAPSSARASRVQTPVPRTPDV